MSQEILQNQEYRCDVLAIGAHPDDVEHAIGGTMLHLKQQGMKCVILHMTHGEAGTYGSRSTRDEEAKAAADYLGAEVRWLDFPDSMVRDSVEARLKLVKAIREIRPRTILTQYPDYALMHPDHEETGKIVRGAFRICRFRNVETGEAPFWIPSIHYYLLPHHVRPHFVIDVTPYMPQWLELARCYGSQIDSIPGYRMRLEAHKRQAGSLIDVEYGEAFTCDRPLIGNSLQLPLV
jgi:bacillithiol biosynthesis deacetylase BshB1